MAGTPVYTILTQDQRKLYSDLSLSNEYVVEFGLPSDLIQFLGREGYIESGVSLDTRAYGVLCSDISLPGSTFATSEVKDNFLGVTQEFAHTRLYTDIDATFYVDRKYRVLELFQGWMDFISGGSGGKVGQNSQDKGFYRRFRFPDDYKTSVQIAKMERDYGLVGKEYKSRTYNLVNAFPKSVASVPISYGPADILKITVTFNYDRYTIIRENQTGSSSSGSSQQSSTETSVTNTTSGRPSSNSGRVGVLRVKQAKGNITPAEERELRGLTNP
jgi:hypothetical protein